MSGEDATRDEWRDRAFAALETLKSANDNCEVMDVRVAALEEALLIAIPHVVDNADAGDPLAEADLAKIRELHQGESS